MCLIAQHPPKITNSANPSKYNTNQTKHYKPNTQDMKENNENNHRTKNRNLKAAVHLQIIITGLDNWSVQSFPVFPA